MSIQTRILEAAKKIVFGDTLLPQEFTLGLAEPQTEVSVSLRGLSIDQDVTNRLSTACAAPFTLCIGLDEGAFSTWNSRAHLKLIFSERTGKRRVLGEIGLKHKSTISSAGAEFGLFAPRSSRNFCLPKARILSHYLLHAYRQRRKDNTQGMKMSFLERRASIVTFIRPHPIVLVSVGTRDDGNIFPMNLMGDLGNGYFGFALRTERVAGSVVKRAGRVAISSLPLSQGHLSYRFGTNHKKESVDWNQLPFATKMSGAFHIPVPDFAPRVKELEIETSRAIGSHRFFLARIVRDEMLDDGPTFCSVHGFYQFWRLKELRNRERELGRSLVGDSFNKRERHPQPGIQI